jgi:hypothetical protein
VEPVQLPDRPVVLATAELRGRDLVAVHARLGAPAACAFVSHEVHLGYRDGDDVVQPRGVVLVDGIVVCTVPRLQRNAASPCVGQLIARVLPQFGALLGLLPRKAGLELVFASCRVFVHEDRVAHVAPVATPLGLYVLPGELPPFTAAG